MLKVFLFWPKRDKMGMILKGAFPPRKGFFTMKFSEMTYTALTSTRCWPAAKS